MLRFTTALVRIRAVVCEAENSECIAYLMPFNNSSISVTNHFYYPLLGHRHKLNSPVHMYTHTSSYTQMVVCWAAPTTQNKVFLSHPSVSVSLSLNSFGMLNDWQSTEDLATDVSGIHLSAKPVCVCSCVFLQVSKQRDSPVNIFIPVHRLCSVPHVNADHWNVKARDEHSQMRTHLLGQRA